MPVGWVDWLRARRWPWALLGVALLAVLFWRVPIGERLVPDPRLNRTLESAEQALQRGELSRGDNHGAKELFEAVLAVDPDHQAARDGLLRVREAALAQAQAALSRHDYSAAQRAIVLAKELSASAEVLQPLESSLHALENSTGRIDALLRRAREAEHQGLPDGAPGSALSLYQQVLALQPDNATVREARGELLSQRLAQAHRLIAKGDLATARAAIDHVIAIDPAHLDLPTAQAELGAALAQRQLTQERSLRKADADWHAGRIERAAEAYRAVLAQTPDQAQARDGLMRCGLAMAARAERLAADFQFVGAELALKQARAWSPGASAVAMAERKLRQSRALSQRLGLRPSAKERRRVPGLLSEARAAMARGDFIEPPGESAWDRLRVAAALAPKDPNIARLQDELARRVRTAFEQSLADNRLVEAQERLDALLLVNPGRRNLGNDRRRLADRWLAYGEERLGASELDKAQTAYERARVLDPGNPQLKDFAARLQQARSLQH